MNDETTLLSKIKTTNIPSGIMEMNVTVLGLIMICLMNSIVPQI
jgi:hypothetical protein